MAYVITEPCIDVKDKSCIEECPVDCIYEGDRMLYIHPDECVDCGACEPVCPVEAIFYEDDVPAQWKDFTQTNAAFFTEGDDPLGSPGGFAKIGPQVRDTLRRQLPAPRQLTAHPRADVGGTGQRRDRVWRWVAVGRGEPHPPILDRGRSDWQGGAQLGVAVATFPEY